MKRLTILLAPFLFVLCTTPSFAAIEDDVKALQKIISIQQSELSSIKAKQNEGQAYYYTGALATPAAWEADVIFNKNYKAFCAQMGKTYVKSQDINQHYHTGRGNGYFYKDWYYAGTRFCADDTPVYGNGTSTDPYNVWQYKGNCGCCPDRGDKEGSATWTMETSALIYCK